MKDLAMFDSLLSSRKRIITGEDDEDMIEVNEQPMFKTKAITKNYGTRFAKPFKLKVSLTNIIYVIRKNDFDFGRKMRGTFF